MPEYVYHHCGREFEIIKSMRQSSDPESCPHCGKEADRIFTPAQISPTAKAFEPHWNYGLGKTILNKGQIKEELARVKGETGKEIVEVGSDNLQSVKKKFKSYDISREDIERVKAQGGTEASG